MELTKEQQIVTIVVASAFTALVAVDATLRIRKLVAKMKFKKQVWLDIEQSVAYTSSTPEEQKLLKKAFFTGKTQK